MVEEYRCQEILRGDLGISCERRVGKHQARRIDGIPASRVHSEHHRETAGKNAELPPAAEAGQALGIPERSALPRCVRSNQWIRSDRWVVAG